MKTDKSEAFFATVMIAPVIWVGLLIAPHLSKGLPELVPKLPDLLNNPFHIHFCSSSLRTVFICLLIYGLGVGVYFSSKKIIADEWNTEVQYGVCLKN